MSGKVNKLHAKAIENAKNKLKSKGCNGNADHDGLFDDNEWNVAATVGASINFEKEEADICVWEQIINAYLPFLAVRFNEEGDPDRVNILQFDREFQLSANGDLVILTAPSGETREYDFLFSFPPEIIPCKRDTECNQLVRIVENSVYIDTDAFSSVLITPFTLVFAEDDNLIVLSFESLICGNDDISDELMELVENKDTLGLKEVLDTLEIPSSDKFKGKKPKKVSIKGKSALKVRLVKQA